MICQSCTKRSGRGDKTRCCAGRTKVMRGSRGSKREVCTIQPMQRNLMGVVPAAMRQRWHVRGRLLETSKRTAFSLRTKRNHRALLCSPVVPRVTSPGNANPLSTREAKHRLIGTMNAIMSTWASTREVLKNMAPVARRPVRLCGDVLTGVVRWTRIAAVTRGNTAKSGSPAPCLAEQTLAALSSQLLEDHPDAVDQDVQQQEAPGLPLIVEAVCRTEGLCGVAIIPVPPSSERGFSRIFRASSPISMDTTVDSTDRSFV